jgi:hypothetical protein
MHHPDAIAPREGAVVFFAVIARTRWLLAMTKKTSDS